jgi:hypothetical protein
MGENYFKYSVVKALCPLISILLFTTNSNAVTSLRTNAMLNNYVDTSVSDSDLLKNKEYLYIYCCYFAQGEKEKNAVPYLKTQLGMHIAASTDLTGAAGNWTPIFGEGGKFGSTPSTFGGVVAGRGRTFVEPFLNSGSSVEGRTSLLLRNVEVMTFGGSGTWATVNRPPTVLVVNTTEILFIKMILQDGTATSNNSIHPRDMNCNATIS